MPLSNIEGFVTPLDKYKTTVAESIEGFGNAIQKQQLERAKAEEGKKLLNKSVEDINPKDFISATIIDGKTAKDIYELKQKANEAIAQSKGNLDQATFNSWLAPQVAKIATRVQNAKQVKAQLDKGAEEMKTTPGFDLGKYYQEGNKYFLNPDGSVREDIENIDPSKNYYQEILNNGNVWTSDAIHSILKEVPTVSDTKSLDVRDVKGNRRKTMQELTYNPTFYQPKFTGTDFEGFQPETENALDDKGQVVVDANKNAVPILGHNSYAFLMSKPQSMAYINQRKRQIAQENNLDPNSVQVENAVRAELHDLVGTSPYRKASSKEIQQQQAPIVKNYMGGKGEGGEAPFNPIYQKLDTIGNDLIQNKQYKFIPINKLPGDVAEAVKKSYASAMGKKPEDTTTAEFAINKLPTGEWGLFSAENGKPVGNVVKTLSEDELNLGEAKGVKERKPILKKETKLPGYVGKTSQTYKLVSNGKSYTHQELINLGYTEADIKQALSSGNIKTK